MNLITQGRRPGTYLNTPLASLLGLSRDIDRLFANTGANGESVPVFAPALEIREDKDNVVVNVELPGVDRKDVSLTLHDGVLSISGERKPAPEVAGEEILRSERNYGRFERQITLAHPLEGDRVKAAYKDGVLTVTLPKTADAKPKTIDIATA